VIDICGESIEVYGFGSFFDGQASYRDIDLLLVHNDTSRESCEFAISCKEEIIRLHSGAHITMLSKGEEESISFIDEVRFVLLGEIVRRQMADDVINISSSIRRFVKILGKFT
jgi:hypothetical protein